MRIKKKYLQEDKPPAPDHSRMIEMERLVASLLNENIALTKRVSEAVSALANKAPIVVDREKIVDRTKPPVTYEFTFHRNFEGYIMSVIAKPLVVN